MAEKSAREPRVYLWDTSRQVGTNLNAILRGRIFVQMLPRPPRVSHSTRLGAGGANHASISYTLEL